MRRWRRWLGAMMGQHEHLAMRVDARGCACARPDWSAMAGAYAWTVLCTLALTSDTCTCRCRRAHRTCCAKRTVVPQRCHDPPAGAAVTDGRRALQRRCRQLLLLPARRRLGSALGERGQAAEPQRAVLGAHVEKNDAAIPAVTAAQCVVLMIALPCCACNDAFIDACLQAATDTHCNAQCKAASSNSASSRTCTQP